MARRVLADDAVDYAGDVKPILRERCLACHGALKQEASLRLDTAALVRQGGDSGAAIAPGDATGSLLLARVSDPDPATRMPPEGQPLTDTQIETLRAWIAAGAPAPSDEVAEEDPRRHWAFQMPVRAALPAVANPAWAANPIDVFLAAEHDRLGLTPVPPADRAILLRRVYLDLVGLPPTRVELRAFLADESPDAYERVVDRLLASPQYGERWGRHWMDVWRYSDWYGRRAVPDVMNSYPQIWRWRDWIVRSLNEDKGYDAMVQQMLAADELTPAEDENVVATGFVVRNWYKWNYHQWMKDAVEHTGKAFLGLTLNCCHCHDHKYDPITQEEYFKFRAFFEPLELRHDRVAGLPDPGPFKKYVYAQSYGPIASGAIRVFDEKLDAQTLMYTGGDARNVIAGRPPVPPGAPAAIGGDRLHVEPIELPPTAFYPGLKPFVQHEETAARQAAVTNAEEAVSAARTAYEQSRPALEAEVAAADAELIAAQTEAAAQPGNIAALNGMQSLLLDAAMGRRTLAHTLPGLTKVDGQTVVSFRVRILDDGHTNFQLGLDLATGATGTFVSFDNGRIVAYQPGGFAEFEAGRYDMAAGQDRFDVRFALDPSGDRSTLTVNCLPDGPTLVAAALVALNGWNPPVTGKGGLFIDARPGSVAIYDDIRVQQGEANELLIDFEPAEYADGQDVAGRPGWLEPPYSIAPATSRVFSVLAQSPRLQAAMLAAQSARGRLNAARLAVAAAEARQAAAESDLASIQARIAADRARYGITTDDASALAASAAMGEREATLRAAEAAVIAAERALAEAEGKPPTDAKRNEGIQAAQQTLTAARAAVEAAKQAAQATSTDYTPLSPVYPRQSTGRRAALARWITDRQNPLTARVAVNHIWLRHFGGALVESTFDFGRNGKRPTHPALLDWLVVEFMDHGWSMKHLHRLIVTSQAYRLRSSAGGGEHPNLAIDPDNHWLWRANAGRMQAEVVRDSVLYVAGDLDATIGGQEIDHAQGLTSRRRSLYFAHHGESKMEFLDLFDGANACDCYRRTTSVLPQQALAMANSELSLREARALAGTLWDEVSVGAADAECEPAFIRAAFEQVLARGPTDQEQAVSAAFLMRQRMLLAATSPIIDAAARARQNLVHSLLSHNDFVTIR